MRQCPECGSFTALEEDPFLPESHRVIMCNNDDCHVKKLGEKDIEVDE